MRILVLLLFASLAGCSLDPRPLEYGHDRCTHCMMTLTDPRFGAELVTPQGKRLPFDAIECLAAYVTEQKPEVHTQWVIDFTAPEVLRPIEEVVLYRSPAIPSPMGMNLGAFPDAEAASRQAPDGEALDWEEVLRIAGRPEDLLDTVQTRQ
jgi:copper chaperone NosL